jgi:precorrin-6A/cobalt-precorrin-6A reductase
MKQPERRILLLGGTGEARDLADRLKDAVGIAVITSLAGRTAAPHLPPGEVRIGGFGGIEGLSAYLKKAAIDAVIDATHPYATGMTRNAAEACNALAVPRLLLRRPAWQAQSGDNWIKAASLEEAASEISRGPWQRIFLSTGRQEITHFAGLTNRWFLLRTVDPLVPPLPAPIRRVEVGRGPFDLAAETLLLKTWGIDLLVTKNSGGTATYAKIAAARAQKLPVIMITRPQTPEGKNVSSVAEAVRWALELP